MNTLKLAVVLLTLTGCGPKYHLQKFVLPSESPCIDGTIINVHSNGCESFFWGVRSETVKIRCTMTNDQNWWANTSFYFMPKNSPDPVSEHWKDFCQDRDFKVYVGPTLLRVGPEVNVEDSGLSFRGTEHFIKNGEILER